MSLRNVWHLVCERMLCHCFRHITIYECVMVFKKKQKTFFSPRCAILPRDASGFYVNAMASDLCCVEMFNGVCL